MPISKWLKGAPALPKVERDPRNVGTTNFANSQMIGSASDLAGPPSPAEIGLWRKERAEKVARGEDPAAIARERQAKKDKRNEKLKNVLGMSGKKKMEGHETIIKDKESGYQIDSEDGIMR